MHVATPGKRYGHHWEADRSIKVQGIKLQIRSLCSESQTLSSNPYSERQSVDDYKGL